MYDGPWQDFDRDLDPSLLITATASERFPSVAPWWSPIWGWYRSASAFDPTRVFTCEGEYRSAA